MKIEISTVVYKDLPKKNTDTRFTQITAFLQ